MKVGAEYGEYSRYQYFAVLDKRGHEWTDYAPSTAENARALAEALTKSDPDYAPFLPCTRTVIYTPIPKADK